MDVLPIIHVFIWDLEENEGLLYIPMALAEGISNNRSYLEMSLISGIHGSIYGHIVI